ncbi:MAG: DNA/RNA non-specific endonuclease [Flavobacteriaceae bacterium]|nr:DNA/RNA non-specific endonuclease [Flavobacteriaceae bacterium]
MKKRKIYSIIAMLLLIGVYAYDYYLDHQLESEFIESGSREKEETKTFFLPTSTTNQIVHHQNYSLSYKEEHEQAEWVAYELKKSHLAKSNHKRPYFESDPMVKTKSANWRNYKNSNYDRGHLCPAGDRRYSKEAYDETFLTSNISPQRHDFNSGIWNVLEQKTRYWAAKYDGVFVVTGGVLESNLRTIGEEHVAVPNYFYKVLLDYNSGDPKMIGFLMEHENSNKALYHYVVAVDKIEALTGIDFFPQLDDEIEDPLEASSSYKHWSF